MIRALLAVALTALLLPTVASAEGAPAAPHRGFFPGQGGISQGLHPITNNLNQAGRLLQVGRARQAMPYLQQAYHQMANHPNWQVRRLANDISQAYEFARRNQSYQAERIVRGVLQQLGQGGGQDPDFNNRQEWRRDIRDLIATIRDGSLRMAQRDIQTLMRDIRNDGYDWNNNRQHYQRVAYVSQNLRRGNERWAMQELRSISNSLNY